MVLACTVSTLAEAQEYAGLLKEQGLEATAREVPGAQDEPDAVPPAEVRLAQPEDLPRAKELIADYRTWKQARRQRSAAGEEPLPGVDPRDRPPEVRNRAMTFTVLGMMGLCVGLVALPTSAWLAWSGFLIGVAFLCSASGLAEFRRYRWVDLFALAAFLPAVVGLTLRRFEGRPFSETNWIFVTFVVMSLAAWAAIAGVLDGRKVEGSLDRFVTFAVGFALIAAAWMLLTLVFS